MYEVLFQYGAFVLTTFDVLFCVGILLGTIFIVRFTQLKKMSLRFLASRFFWFVLFALIGGRAMHWIEHASFYWENPLSMLYVWDMGFSAFGMLFAAMATLIVLGRRDHEDFWGWLDAFALTGLVVFFFVHIGRFFDGTDYGSPTDMPWGIAFDTFNIPYLTPIHPAQLYSALATFIAFSVAMWTAKRTHLTGVAGTLAVMLYSLSALGIDFFHGEPSMEAKIIFGSMAALGFVFHIHCTHKKWLAAKS